ncbi:OadG family transporter subunit [Porticoccus sp. W117]|uniref:OadG family protein n=1 Tax=Porticoccus sp. W117 TaxID=3054777 RepID=UPI0025914340|nr:OadG family transporter subunit [Porticoccus sp. W117]MDM3869802.1 OadG family transporter subunit [Porticoccus sp. W117]
MTDSLLQQGTNLMLMGMGTVFVFLAILVVATTVMSRVVNRLSPEEVAPEPEPVVAPAGQVDKRVVQIIQAALDKHRGRH